MGENPTYWAIIGGMPIQMGNSLIVMLIHTEPLAVNPCPDELKKNVQGHVRQRIYL